MRIYLERFLSQSSGAASAEFVVLTAACASLALATILMVNTRSVGLGDQIGGVVVIAAGDTE